MSGASLEDAFAAVVRPHLDADYNLPRCLLRDSAAAEDQVQEAMLRALTYFSSFKGVDPRAWLLQNSVQHCAQLEGARPRRAAGADREPGGVAADDLVIGDDDPVSALMKSSVQRQVRDLIAALRMELREPFVLRALEELTYKEIVDITHVPIGTVMSWLWRARQSLARSVSASEAR